VELTVAYSNKKYVENDCWETIYVAING